MSSVSAVCCMQVEPLVSVDDMMPECPPAPHASQNGPGSCSFSCSEFSLHVVRSFALRGDCRLNLQTIMLLGAGGVDAGLFEELVHAELEEVRPKALLQLRPSPRVCALQSRMMDRQAADHVRFAGPMPDIRPRGSAPGSGEERASSAGEPPR